VELPHTLYTGMCSVSLLILIPQILGFFCCEVVLYKTNPFNTQNNKLSFFVLKPLSRVTLGYSNIMFIVSPTTGLTRVPYNLLEVIVQSFSY